MMKLNSLGKLGKRLLSSIVVAAVVIILLVILSIVNIRFFLNENIRGQQALDSIEESTNHLFKAVIDQETGQRGYNLTKDVTFLEPYNNGINEFSSSSEELVQATKKFPDLSTKANELIEKGQYWQERYGESLVELTHNGEQPTTQMILDGKMVLDDFRQKVVSYSEKIEEQRSIVRNKMQTRINFTLAGLFIISIGIIFLNLFINFRILKSVIQPIIELSCCVESYKKYDFSKEIPTYRKKDELFELIQNVDIMRNELSHSISSLESKVNYDELTGLYNRRYFNEFIIKEWENAKVNSENFSLIIFDIDHYKKFNDTYGHLAGDDCLKSISHCLQDLNLPPRNFVARYGGEEFCVLLLQRTEQEAVAIAEEIRKAVLGLKIPHRTSPTNENVTVSLGVSTIIPTGELQPNDIISMADTALYQSKHNGRNQVTQYIK